VWEGLDVDRRRAVIDASMSITLHFHPAGAYKPMRRGTVADVSCSGSSTEHFWSARPGSARAELW
jgi:hypothetical protein